MVIPEFLDIIYSIFPMVGLLYAWKNKLYRDLCGKYLMLMLGLHLFIETFATIHFTLQLGRNVFLNSINDIVSLIIISRMIYLFTNKNQVVRYTSILFSVTVIILLLFIEGFNNYAPLAYSIQETGIIILCFLFFWSLYKDDQQIIVQDRNRFITVALVLTLHCGSFFTSIMILRITKDSDTYALYNLQLLMDFIIYLGMMVLLFFIPKQKPTQEFVHN